MYTIPGGVIFHHGRFGGARDPIVMLEQGQVLSSIDKLVDDTLKVGRLLRGSDQVGDRKQYLGGADMGGEDALEALEEWLGGEVTTPVVIVSITVGKKITGQTRKTSLFGGLRVQRIEIIGERGEFDLHEMKPKGEIEGIINNNPNKPRHLALRGC